MVAASIRSNNPGAMWGKGNKIAAKWGSTGTQSLADGLGQGNNIAYFPTKLAGACAQFDLWRNGYCNMTLRNAILKWSGHNWSQPYANFLVARTGIGLDDVITPDILASGAGLKLMVAQAQWEAGQAYPMTNAEWIQAQNKVFLAPGIVPPEHKKTAAATAVVVATAGTATVAAKSGVHWSLVLFILVAGVVVAGAAYLIAHHAHENGVTPPGDHPPAMPPRSA